MTVIIVDVEAISLTVADYSHWGCASNLFHWM